MTPCERLLVTYMISLQKRLVPISMTKQQLWNCPDNATMREVVHFVCIRAGESKLLVACDMQLSYPRVTLAPEEPSAHQAGSIESPFLQQLQPQPLTAQQGYPGRNDSAEEPAANGASSKSMGNASSKQGRK